VINYPGHPLNEGGEREGGEGRGGKEGMGSREGREGELNGHSRSRVLKSVERR